MRQSQLFLRRMTYYVLAAIKCSRTLEMLMFDIWHQGLLYRLLKYNIGGSF